MLKFGGRLWIQRSAHTERTRQQKWASKIGRCGTGHVNKEWKLNGAGKINLSITWGLNHWVEQNTGGLWDDWSFSNDLDRLWELNAAFLGMLNIEISNLILWFWSWETMTYPKEQLRDNDMPWGSGMDVSLPTWGLYPCLGSAVVVVGTAASTNSGAGIRC